MFASLLALAWMDLFVPTGMAIVMVLLSVVKNAAMYFIIFSDLILRMYWLQQPFF